MRWPPFPQFNTKWSTEIVMSKSQLTGMAGVYFVAAEASMRGLIASPASRSAMAADLLVSDYLCRTAYSVQVKTNKVTFGFWLMGAKCLEIASPALTYVLVNIRKNEIEYFILPSEIVAQKIIISKASDTRKQAWYSIYRKDILDYQNRWDILGADNKDNEPNKAMEPIPINVTVPADAGTAPFTSMAQFGR